MSKSILAYLFGDSQLESELEEARDHVQEILEAADKEEPIESKKTPLSKALKEFGIEVGEGTNGLELDPEGFSLRFDDDATYHEVATKLSSPEAMEKLAEMGWVAHKLGDRAMSNEPPEYRVRFIEITTVEATDHEKADSLADIMKRGREFATTQMDRDDETNPVEHPEAPNKKHDGMRAATDGPKADHAIHGGKSKSESQEENPKAFLARKVPAFGPKTRRLQMDAIQSWLADTTEPFDNWTWDGNELKLYQGGSVTERYDRSTVESQIFTNYPALSSPRSESNQLVDTMIDDETLTKSVSETEHTECPKCKKPFMYNGICQRCGHTEIPFAESAAKCRIKGCESSVSSSGLCAKHLESRSEREKKDGAHYSTIRRIWKGHEAGQKSWQKAVSKMENRKPPGHPPKTTRIPKS